MEKPFTIGFSRQGEMDFPVQYEIVYAESNDQAMFKWIKDNPRDIFRSYSNEPSSDEDIAKYGKKTRLEVGDVLFRLRNHTAAERLKIDRVSDQLAFSGEYKFVRSEIEPIRRVTDHGGMRKEFGESFELETPENSENRIREIRLRFIRNFDYHLLDSEELVRIEEYLKDLK